MNAGSTQRYLTSPLFSFFSKNILLTSVFFCSFYIEISDSFAISRNDSSGGGMPTLADDNLSIDVVAKAATYLFGPLYANDLIL